MKCPRDGTQLAAVRIADIELDKCHRCDGIWCDPGEMEQLRDAKINLTDRDKKRAKKRRWFADPLF